MPKCGFCKIKFVAKYFNQKFCLEKDECIIAHKEYAVKLKEKKDKAQTKKLKETLLTHSDYLKMAQTVVNAYVRLRDINKGCITCGTDLRGRKFDAGHFFSVGAYPNIRFNLDNIHGQCVPCNQHKHGNNAEYFIKLPKRIGLDRFNELLEIRHKPIKYSVEELKELITEYKLKIKNYDTNK